MSIGSISSTKKSIRSIVNLEGKYRTAVAMKPDLKFILQMGLFYSLGLPEFATFDGDIMGMLCNKMGTDFPLPRILGEEGDYSKLICTIKECVSEYRKDNSDKPYNLQRFIDGLSALTPVTGMRSQIAFIRGLGLPELAGYDGDLIEYLSGIPENNTFHETREQVREFLIENLIEQVKNNGPTLFMDMEKMLASEAAPIVHFIIKQRKVEIARTVIYKRDNVDLRPLWLTGWGYEILKALKAGLQIKRSQFDEVKERFTEAGFILSTTSNRDNTVSPVVISEVMMSAIEWMVEDDLM